MATPTKRNKLEIIDGQHRVAACRIRGDIDTVPTVIIHAVDAQAAARAFVRANRDRVTVTPLHVHHAMLTAGDEQAATIQRVIDKGGVSVPRYPIQASQMKPGQTLAIGTIYQSVQVYGEAAAVAVLQLLAAAFAERSGEIRAGFIRALCRISAWRSAAERDAMVKILRSVKEWQIRVEAAEIAETEGVDRSRAFAIALERRLSAATSAVDAGDTIDEDWVAAVEREESEQEYSEGPLNRRCASCNTVFQAARVGDVNCPECTGKGRRAA